MVNISESLGIMIPFLCLEREEEVVGKTVG